MDGYNEGYGGGYPDDGYVDPGQGYGQDGYGYTDWDGQEGYQQDFQGDNFGFQNGDAGGGYPFQDRGYNSDHNFDLRGGPRAPRGGPDAFLGRNPPPYQTLGHGDDRSRSEFLSDRKRRKKDKKSRQHVKEFYQNRGRDVPDNTSQLATVQKGTWQGVERKHGPLRKSEHIEGDVTSAEVWSDFANTTTMAGPLRMHLASAWRSFWIIVFIIAFCMMALQLGFIVEHYLDFPTTYQSDAKKDEIPFPSVTICNINPIRRNQLSQDTELQNYINDVENLISNIDISLNTNDQDYLEDLNLNAADLDDYYYYTDDKLGNSYDFTNTAVESSSKLHYDFMRKAADIALTTRASMGHQAEIMIQKCSFNGKKCSFSDFSTFYSKHYGNCFTFNTVQNENDEQRVSRRPGQPFGLSLQLLREHTEYLSGYTVGEGVRVVVHPFDTKPFPRENGFTISPGMETNVKVNYDRINRLGDPYEDCYDSNKFRSDYGREYTQDSCEYTCAAQEILDACSCAVDEDEEEYYPPSDIAYTSCYNTPDRKACAYLKIQNLQLGVSSYCKCPKACKDHEFKLSTATAAWPEVGMWNAFVSRMCAIDSSPTSSCEVFRAQNAASEQTKDYYMKRDFLALNVYVDEYNKVTEMAAYPFSTLAADLGGTFALWMGLSFISLIEICALMGRLCYACCGCYDTGRGGVKQELGIHKRVYHSNWLSN